MGHGFRSKLLHRWVIFHPIPNDNLFNLFLGWYIYIYILWRFPKIEVPLVIIHFSGIFPYKPCSYWGTPICGNLHIVVSCCIICCIYWFCHGEIKWNGLEMGVAAGGLNTWRLCHGWCPALPAALQVVHEMSSLWWSWTNLKLDVVPSSENAFEKLFNLYMSSWHEWRTYTWCYLFMLGRWDVPHGSTSWIFHSG